MSPKLRYWVQSADFSAKDYDPVDLIGAERLLTSPDWQTALAFMRARSHGEYCPPGIGFVTDDSRLLHICPNENGTASCTYLLVGADTERMGLETLDPSQEAWSGFDLPLLAQYRALQLFYRGDYGGVIRTVMKI